MSNAIVMIYLHIFNALKYFKQYDKEDRLSDLPSLDIGCVTYNNHKLYIRRWQIVEKDGFTHNEDLMRSRMNKIITIDVDGVAIDFYIAKKRKSIEKFKNNKFDILFSDYLTCNYDYE